MNDYEFHKDILKPTNAYASIVSPKKSQKQKVTAERSKSRDKVIVTSFSKKQLAEAANSKVPFSNPVIRNNKVATVASPISKKSQCHSEYYFKTAETKTQADPLQMQDDIQIKDGQIETLTKRLTKAETLVTRLTSENQLKTARIETMGKEMNTLLAKTLKSLEIEHIGTDLTYQVEKYRQDQRRLLKMLETTSEFEYFSKLALLDDGVEFLRFPNQAKKSSLDAASSKKPLHFCTCNKEFISESSFWVPEKVYNFGKQFITQRKGQFTKSEYELLLYELNRLWRERQKRIINTLNGQKARQLSKYKRREANYHSLNKNSVSK